MTQLEIMGANAKNASVFLRTAGSKKDDALLAIAKALREHSDEIIKANEIDIENGKKRRSYRVFTRQIKTYSRAYKRYGGGR